MPFIFVIIISVTDEKSILQYGYSFFPSKFGVDGFQFLAQFKDKILQALFISVFVTVVGTVTNVFITTTYAYAISRTTFKYRRFFTIFAPVSYTHLDVYKRQYQEAAAGNALCQEAIERMNRNLAQGLLNIQYLIDPDVISLGGSISQNPDFIQGVKKAVDEFVESYEDCLLYTSWLKIRTKQGFSSILCYYTMAKGIRGNKCINFY